MTKTNEKIIFDAPIHWTLNYVNSVGQTVHSNEAKGPVLGALYGTLNCTGFNSGRVALEHQDIGLEDAGKLVEQVHAHGLQFYYLLNAPLCRKPSLADRECLEQLFGTIRCDAAVVADFGLASFIREHFPRLPLHVSTVANVKNMESLRLWLKLLPSRLVMHHDVPKKIWLLEEMLSVLRKTETDAEMMVTESCLYECPWRSEHYLALGLGKNDRQFHERCLELRRKNMAELFMPGSFVRPQDVRLYHERYGISHFKISGRSQTEKWKLKTIQAYLSSEFFDNLLKLMGMDPQITPDKCFAMPSECLDGYLERLFNGEDHRKLAYEYADRLQKNERL